MVLERKESNDNIIFLKRLLLSLSILVFIRIGTFFFASKTSCSLWESLHSHKPSN